MASGDHYFDKVGLPVDVWHFKCKHKEGDIFCQVHCNPARFKELIGADGETWIFNSSAAEQSNSWFGKFQTIVQEMAISRYAPLQFSRNFSDRNPRYTFFLDEMISIHNEYVVKELERKGYRPHLVPEDILRAETTLYSASI
jgi:hypothetical protein